MIWYTIVFFLYQKNSWVYFISEMHIHIFQVEIRVIFDET